LQAACREKPSQRCADHPGGGGAMMNLLFVLAIAAIFAAEICWILRGGGEP
jgi:hypothetical protein